MKKILPKLVLIGAAMVFVSVLVAEVNTTAALIMFGISMLVTVVLASVNNSIEQREKDKANGISEKQQKLHTLRHIMNAVPFFIIIGGILAIFVILKNDPDAAGAAFISVFVLMILWTAIRSVLERSFAANQEALGTIMAVEWNTMSPCTLIIHKDHLEYEIGAVHADIPYTEINTISLESGDNSPDSLLISHRHGGKSLQLRIAVHKNDHPTCKKLIKLHKKAFQL